MGEIIVSTPDGDKTVVIAGDTPTEQEQQAIVDAFFANAPSTAPTAVEEEPSLANREIDYDTGVQNASFRINFSKGDNEEERRARLESMGVPSEAIEIDQDGEFLLDRDLLPDDVKNKYGIEGSGLLAIDERKGFTSYDFADFYGEARGPLIGGLTASLAATGVGLIPAALIAGGGTALGYLFDEYQESEEGLRRETDEDLGYGVLKEFALGSVGEVGGRGLAAVFGRLIKGSGSQSANEARAIAREAIAGGGRPTLRAANESPILGRLQAIYEGVFPNKAAARANANFVAKELGGRMKAAGYTGKSSNPDDLLNLLNRDIERIYGDPESIVREANKTLDGTVNKEITRLIKMFGDDTKPLDSREIARSIDIAKRIFDEDVDVLYGQANKLLDNKAIVPTEALVKKFEAMAAENPSFNLAGSGLGKFILKFKNQNGTFKNATVQQMNGIRTALREAGFDPNLVGTQNNRFIGEMLGTIEQSFRNAKIIARETMLKGRDASGKFVGKENKKVIEGLDLLDKANTFYGKGVGRFRDANAEKIFRAYKDGELDVEQLFDPNGILLAPNRGDTLNKFFKSVVPGGRQSIDAPKTFDEFLQRGGIDVNMIKQLPDDDYLKSTLMRKFNESRRFADEVAAARGAGVQTREAVRKSISRNYLERLAQQNKNIYGTFNPTKMVDEINRLGSTGRVLFGKEYNSLMKGLQDLGTVNPRIADDELARMAGMPIADQVARVRAILKEQDALANNALAKGLSRAAADRNPEQIVDLIFRKNNAAMIKQAEKELSEETMEAIRQSAMERILGQVSDPSVGAKQFTEDVLTGKHSTQLQKIFDAYGDDTIDAMFGEAGEILRRAVKKSAIVSNKEIAGLGALAPASIATGLGLVAYLTNPLATLGTAVGLKVASSLLRRPFVLKIVTRPTGVRPGKGDYDKLGRLFEMTYETAGLAQAQQAKNIPTPVPTVQSQESVEQQQQQAQQQKTRDSVFTPLNIQSPTAGTPSQVSPLLVPDPVTRATFGVQ